MRKLRLRRWQIFLLLPAIVFIWIVGWGIYWIGQQKGNKAPVENGPEMFVVLEPVAA